MHVLRKEGEKFESFVIPLLLMLNIKRLSHNTLIISGKVRYNLSMPNQK